jgi:hypothetical protein
MWHNSATLGVEVWACAVLLVRRRCGGELLMAPWLVGNAANAVSASAECEVSITAATEGYSAYVVTGYGKKIQTGLAMWEHFPSRRELRLRFVIGPSFDRLTKALP